MANQNFIGIDLGHDQLKLAWVKNGVIKKTVTTQMPAGLIKNGEIVSMESLQELLKETIKKNDIKEKRAAVVLSTDTAFVKNVSLPLMNHEQLLYNLPYEFRDYFSDEMHEYMFDYAMYSTPQEIAEAEKEAAENESGVTINLFASAVKTELIEEVRELLARSGLKAARIAPTASAHRNIIRLTNKDSNEEYCIIDMGYNKIRMNIYKGERMSATRELESGISNIEDTIAQEMNVDKHLAHTYMINNYEGCHSNPRCIDVYNTIGIELMRALNFYQFSNQDSNLKNIYISGGGANIKPLIAVLKEIIGDYEILEANTLIPKFSSDPDMINTAFLAAGIAL